MASDTDDECVTAAQIPPLETPCRSLDQSEIMIPYGDVLGMGALLRRGVDADRVATLLGLTLQQPAPPSLSSLFECGFGTGCPAFIRVVVHLSSANQVSFVQVNVTPCKLLARCAAEVLPPGTPQSMVIQALGEPQTTDHGIWRYYFGGDPMVHIEVSFDESADVREVKVSETPLCLG